MILYVLTYVETQLYGIIIQGHIVSPGLDRRTIIDANIAKVLIFSFDFIYYQKADFYITINIFNMPGALYGPCKKI